MTTVVGGVSTSTVRYFNDYTILHLGGRWKASELVTLNARVNNLLDRNFVSHTCDLVVTQDAFNCLNDYAVVDKRRSLWLSVNVDF